MGSEVILFQAVNISTFLSLLIVLGSLPLSGHGTAGVVVATPCIMKGDGSADAIISFNFAFGQPVSSDAGNETSCEDLLICGAANGSKEDDGVCEVSGLKL